MSNPNDFFRVAHRAHNDQWITEDERDLLAALKELLASTDGVWKSLKSPLYERLVHARHLAERLVLRVENDIAANMAEKGGAK